MANNRNEDRMDTIQDVITGNPRHQLPGTWTASTVLCDQCGMRVSGGLEHDTAGNLVDSANFMDLGGATVCNECLGESWSFSPDTELS